MALNSFRVKATIACFLVFAASSNGLSRSEDGWDYFLLNQYNKAIDAFQTNPEKEEAGSLYGLAMSYMRYGQFNSKIYQQMLPLGSRYYKLLLALKGVKHSIYTSYYLGLTQLNLGEYEPAISSFSSVMADPDVNSRYKGYAEMALGECYFRQGEMDKAKRLWETVEKTIDSDRLLGSELAVLYTEHAVKTSQMLNLCRDYAKVGAPPEQASRFWQNVGWVLYKNGYTEESLDLLSKADMTVPDLVDNVYEEKKVKFYVPVHFERRATVYFANSALILEKLSRESGIRFEEKTLKRISDVTGINRKKNHGDDILYSLALCYLEIGETERAAEVLKRLKDSRDEDILPHVAALLGRAYYQKKQPDSARSEWDEVERNSANNPAALIDLAYTYARLGINRERVRGLLESAKSLDLAKTYFPPYGTIPMSEKYRRMGAAYLNMGEIDEALDSFENGHNRAGKSTVSNLRRGNEPLLLVDIAFAFYLKGYNSYSQPTEMYLVMQRYYPELIQLHNLIQGIFALWPYVDDATKDMLKGEGMSGEYF
jgi:tetratricopeptide (TPR) repeat protein